MLVCGGASQKPKWVGKKQWGQRSRTPVPPEEFQVFFMINSWDKRFLKMKESEQGSRDREHLTAARS